MLSSQEECSDQYSMRTGVPAYPAYSQDDDSSLGRLAVNFRGGDYQSDNSNSQNAMDQSDCSFTQRVDEDYENNSITINSGYVKNPHESANGHFSFLQAQIKRDRSDSAHMFGSTLTSSKHQRGNVGNTLARTDSFDAAFDQTNTWNAEILDEISPKSLTNLPPTPSSAMKKMNMSPNNHSYATTNNITIHAAAIPTSRLDNDFEIVDTIGKGTFGVAYRARNKIDGLLYAVKRSLRRFRGNLDKENMMHEVQALAALSANEDVELTCTIVRYFSAWFESDEHLVISMELCECSVEGMVKGSFQFAYSEIYLILRDVLHALRVLHKNNFVHLDIKPANILKKNGRYKLGDFGLALHIVDGKAAPGSVEEGDSRYMARELLDWKPVEDLTKCDIFSLGISAYELSFQGAVSLPTEGPDWHSLRDGVIRTVDHSPAEFVTMINAMMNPMPAQRPSALQLCDNFFVLKSETEKLWYTKNLQHTESQQINNHNIVAKPLANRLKRSATMW